MTIHHFLKRFDLETSFTTAYAAEEDPSVLIAILVSWGTRHAALRLVRVLGELSRDNDSEVRRAVREALHLALETGQPLDAKTAEALSFFEHKLDEELRAAKPPTALALTAHARLLMVCNSLDEGFTPAGHTWGLTQAYNAMLALRMTQLEDRALTSTARQLHARADLARMLKEGPAPRASDVLFLGLR